MATDKKIMTPEELDHKIKETQSQTEEIRRETEEIRRETEEIRRETEEMRCESEKARRKTEESLHKLSKELRQHSGEFNRKWGDFMENLIEGDLVSLLRNRGLDMIDAEIQPIPKVVVPRDDGTPKYELDLIVKNGDFAIVVEVKTTLTVDKIDDFRQKLEMLKDDLPAYKNKTVYACMAYLKTDKGEEKQDRVLAYLEEQGLFAIRAPGGPANIATITNAPDFVPRAF